MLFCCSKNSPLLLKYVDFRHTSSRSATLSGERVVLSANVPSCQDCRVLGEITLIHLAEAQLWWAGMEKESHVWCYAFNHFQKNPEVVVQLCHHSLPSDQSLAGAMRIQDPISIVLQLCTYLIASHFQLIDVCLRRQNVLVWLNPLQYRSNTLCAIPKGNTMDYTYASLLPLLLLFKSLLSPSWTE